MPSRIVWINKATWKKPGPITYMGLLNALAFAFQGQPTDFYISSEQRDDPVQGLRDFYGLQPHPLLNIHPIQEKKASGRRAVYQAGLQAIEQYCRAGETVIAITRELGLLQALIRLRRRYPLLRVYHEVHDYFGSVKHLPVRRFASYRRMLAERMLLGKLDGLICLTEYQRALYQQWLPRLPMLVAPLGSALSDQGEYSYYPQRRQHRRIAYIGHLHSYKGLSQIFQLAESLRDLNVVIQCYGGQPNQVHQLTQQAKQKNLHNIVHFSPFLSPSALYQELQAHVSVGLVPLQDTYYSRYLTCPVKALDFLKIGLPIVGSNLPSVRDVVQDAAILVEPTDIQAYHDSILELLERPELYDDLSQKSFQRSLELSWPRRAAAILAFDHSLRSLSKHDKESQDIDATNSSPTA